MRNRLINSVGFSLLVLGLYTQHLHAGADTISAEPYVQAGPNGFIFKKLAVDATELSDQQKCMVDPFEKVELLSPPEAYSLKYLSIRLKVPRENCRFLEGFVYSRHAAAQSPIHYPFEKTDFWIDTKDKGTYFKINESDSGSLNRGTGKCLMDPKTRYYLDDVPGRISPTHLRVSLGNLIPSCQFTHGYIFADHISGSSHPSVLVKPNQSLGEMSYAGKKWPASWSKGLADSIGELVPKLLDNSFVPKSDINSLCPGFFSATDDEKKSFWTLFMAAIAYPESGWDPSPPRFKEPGLKDQFGQVYSEGLLQLSQGDGGHGSVCDFRYRGDIDIDSATDNLRCGIVIMKNQIQSRKRLFLPESYYYWSVLTNKEKTVRRVFNSQLNKLKFCF